MSGGWIVRITALVRRPGLRGMKRVSTCSRSRKRGDEVADLVVADRGQQRRAQSEAARADADVGRAAADVGVEAADVGDRHADLVRVEVDLLRPMARTSRLFMNDRAV